LIIEEDEDEFSFDRDKYCLLIKDSKLEDIIVVGQQFIEIEQIKTSIWYQIGNCKIHLDYLISFNNSIIFRYEHTNFVLINSPADILVHPRTSQISTWKNLDVIFSFIDHSALCTDLS
jgi:hypothetical protein